MLAQNESQNERQDESKNETFIPDLVSIITPLYNAERFIQKTIESVLAQSYTEWEMILIDDTSSDSGLSIVRELQERVGGEKIRLLVNEENLGPAKSRNRGIEIARGRYLAFIDSDDLWLPQKLEHQLAEMKRAAENQQPSPLCYTAHYKIDEEGEQLALYPAIERLTYSRLLKANFIRFSSLLYDRQALGTVYLPDIRKRQDYALCLLLLRKTEYALGLQEPLLLYRVVEGSVSNSNKFKLLKYNWQVFRHCENFSLFRSLFYLGYNVFYKLFIKR